MTSSPLHAEIIGDPVAHLRSPMVMRFWIDKERLSARYDARAVTRADLATFIAARRTDPDWRGCNVAAPLKLDALLLADVPTDRATAAGAANLLAMRDGQLIAANTDVPALAAVLAPLLERNSEAGVTVLGDGAAARSTLVALKLLGAIPLARLQSRDLSAATKLAVEFGLHQGPIEFDRPIATSGLVNATPLGRPDHPAIHFDLAPMPADGWVLDLVADPAETDLLRAARARGLLGQDGVAVLVEQCAASFELLFGAAPPRGHDEQLFAMMRA